MTGRKQHLLDVVRQESPVAAVLETVARSWLSERSGRADALRPAVASA